MQVRDLIRNMHMNRERSNQRIESLLKVHIEALRGDPNAAMIVQALENARSDFHGLVTEIYDELDAILEQAQTDAEADQAQIDDGA